MTLWTVTHQVPLSVEFSRPEYWSGLLFPPPGDLPDPGIEPRSPALQADSLPFEPPGKLASAQKTNEKLLASAYASFQTVPSTSFMTFPPFLGRAGVTELGKMTGQIRLVAGWRHSSSASLTSTWASACPSSMCCSRCSCVHGRSLSCVPLFATPWTVACQAPLSMGFPRQEYWRRLACPPPGDLPDPGIKLTSPALAGGFFTSCA